MTVCLKFNEGVVLGTELKKANKLQINTQKKIYQIDENTVVTFTGLHADARSVIDLIRRKAQSFRLSYEEAPSINYIVKEVANVMQRFTQTGGARPFGFSIFVIGFDQNNIPRIAQIDPSGMINYIKAGSLGLNN